MRRDSCVVTNSSVRTFQPTARRRHNPTFVHPAWLAAALVRGGGWETTGLEACARALLIGSVRRGKQRWGGWT